MSNPTADQAEPYRVRACRGHWHVESADGEFDLAFPGDPFPTADAAQTALEHFLALFDDARSAITPAAAQPTGETTTARERIKQAWGDVEQAYIDGAPSSVWIACATALWQQIDAALATGETTTADDMTARISALPRWDVMYDELSPASNGRCLKRDDVLAAVASSQEAGERFLAVARNSLGSHVVDAMLALANRTPTDGDAPNG